MAELAPFAWIAVAPVVRSYRGKTPIPLALAGGVYLAPPPVWLKDEKTVDSLGYFQRQDVANARCALIAEYNARSLGDPDPSWKGSKPRGMQDVISERIILANTALWLSRPSPLAFEILLHADGSPQSASVRSCDTHSPLMALGSEDQACLTNEDVLQARAIHQALLDLARDGTVRVAIRALWQALTETWWEGRYLLTWTVLEALFGPEDAREITYRLAQRLGMFLGQSGSEAREVFDAAKDCYGWRSKIVHGLRLSKLENQESIDVMTKSESLVRDGLRKILLDPILIQKFDGKEREKFLDHLVFRD